MKEIDNDAIVTFLEGHYLNYNHKRQCKHEGDIHRLVYSFCDRWMYTLNDLAYLLWTMGYRIVFDEGKYVFAEISKIIDIGVKVGDVIINEDILKTPLQVIRLDRIACLNILRDGILRVIKVRVPYFVSKENDLQLFSTNDNYGYIKLNSFRGFDKKDLQNFVTGKRKLTIDLRCNMGGRINDMLPILSLLTRGENGIEVMDSKKKKYVKRILPSGRDYCNEISAIDFLVSSLTASSAEIFLMLLRSMYDGKIIGEKTMGKHVIQDIISVDGICIAVPIYQFIPPKFKKTGELQLNEDNQIVPDVPGGLRDIKQEEHLI